MIKYSIYTEALNIDKLKEIARQRVSDSFSVQNLDGCYKGIEEKSVKFEFIVEGNLDGAIGYFAEACKEFNHQTVVLITKEQVNLEYVY